MGIVPGGDFETTRWLLRFLGPWRFERLETGPRMITLPDRGEYRTRDVPSAVRYSADLSNRF